MATLRKEIPVAAGATPVWQALRDFGQVHTKVAPGFLTDLRMDKGDRIVTFFNGLVARERLVTADDEACRLVYAVIEGRASHYKRRRPGLPRGRRQPSCVDDRSLAGRAGARDRWDDGRGGRRHEKDAG